jgi:hypothetical protein
VEAVQVREAENREVYLTFSPRFEHIWLESKNRLLEFAAQKPANIGLRSRMPYALTIGRKSTPRSEPRTLHLEHLRTLLGLDPVKDAGGNVILEARLVPWANFRQRALDTAIREINAKTDLHIQLESLERSRHGRVAALTFAIKAQAVPKDDSLPAKSRK